MTLAPKISVRFQGPFFTADPSKTIRSNINAMLESIASEVEADVRDHFPIATGAGSAGVWGRVQDSRTQPGMVRAVISQQHIYPWPGGSPKQYRGGRLERKLGMFKRAAKRVRVARADLAKGIA